MKRSLSLMVAAVVALVATLPTDAEAKRLGGARSFGMQRSTTPAPAAIPPKPAAPTQQAAPAAAAAKPAPAAPAAQPARRNWLGPIAGLAAGIGLAALLSHFGMGEEVANILMIALLVMAAIFLFRLLFRRAAPQARYAGAGADVHAAPMHFEAENVGAGDTPASVLVPADFDSEGFLRQARLNFIRLQAANDRGDLDDLKNFTTPEVFAELRLQFDERIGAAQQTDVVQLDAALLEVVSEGGQHRASVHFHGLLREDRDAAPAGFDEVWHLTKPIAGNGGWRVAGIQQLS